MNRKPSYSPSCCWLAGLQAPGLCPSDSLVCPAHSLSGMEEVGGWWGAGKEELVFVIPLREETWELLPVLWSGLPLRMP